METDVKHAGLGFAEALTLLFIALKLCGVINWSWAWVLCPLWITIILCAIVAIIIVGLTGLRRTK